MSVGYSEPPKPLSAIEDFCERFDKAVKNNLPKVRRKSDGKQRKFVASAQVTNRVVLSDELFRSVCFHTESVDVTRIEQVEFFDLDTEEGSEDGTDVCEQQDAHRRQE